MFDPGVSEVIQHVGLLGIQLQGLQEVGLRFRPLLAAFVGDAAEIQQRPVALLDLSDTSDGLFVSLGCHLPVLAAALEIADSIPGLETLRLGFGEGF